MKKPPYKFLSKIFKYDHLSGIVYWAVPIGKKIKAGQRAGSMTKEGYRQVAFTFKSKKFWLSEHHICWFLYHKEWPIELDHKDHNRSNNKIKNLRKATRSQNVHNRNHKKWVGVQSYITAMIHVENQRIQLGKFKTRKEAALAYNKAALKYFGEFAKLNKVPMPLSKAMQNYWRKICPIP